MHLQMINVKWLLILWNVLLLVKSSYNVDGTADEKLSTASLKNDILSNPQEAPTNRSEDDGANACREISLHRCGSSMVRVFRLLDFLPWKKSFEAKCALRNAFFKCMKSEDEPCKNRRWRFDRSSKFRKRLVRSLWSTRGCVLGLKGDGAHV